MSSRILIIDDNPALVEIVRAYLYNLRGPTVMADVAFTMGSAVEKLQAHSYALILLDLTLPDSTCAQTIARLEEIRKLGREATIVIITGSQLDDEEFGRKRNVRIIRKGTPHLTSDLTEAFSAVP